MYTGQSGEVKIRTFRDISQIIRPISISRYILPELTPPFQFPLQQVAFIEEEDELDLDRSHQAKVTM